MFRAEDFIPCTPFTGLPVSGAKGIVINDRDGLGIATILARKGMSGPLSKRMREHFGIELPRGPHRTRAGDISIAGIGPDAWLATRAQGGNDLAPMLKQGLGDLGSVVDQSDGYAVLRLTGPKVRDALCKLMPVDVHPRSFKVADVAITAAAHIGVMLWRLEDEAEGCACFELAITRSFARSFWGALAHLRHSPEE